MNINGYQYTPSTALCHLYALFHLTLIYFFNKYLSSAYHGPGTVLGSREQNRQNVFLSLGLLSILGWDSHSKTKNKHNIVKIYCMLGEIKY